MVVLGHRVTLGRGRGTSKVLFPISSVNSLYIFGSNDSVFTVFGNSAFCIVTAWQRGLWVLFRFIFYIKDLVFIVKDARVGFFNNPCMATDLDYLSLHPWAARWEWESASLSPNCPVAFAPRVLPCPYRVLRCPLDIPLCHPPPPRSIHQVQMI